MNFSLGNHLGCDRLGINMWNFHLTFLWLGTHALKIDDSQSLDMNITYENLGDLFVEATKCHVRSEFNLEEFLRTLSLNEKHFNEVNDWLTKVIENLFSFSSHTNSDFRDVRDK